MANKRKNAATEAVEGDGAATEAPEQTPTQEKADTLVTPAGTLFSVPQGFTLEESVQQLYASERYVGQGGKIIFDSPPEIIEPFVEDLKDLASLGVRLWGRHQSEVRVQGTDGEDHIAYGRFALLAEVGDDILGHKMTFGRVVRMDTARPEIQTFFGATATVCVNLHIWSAELIKTFNVLNQGEKSAREELKRYIDAFAKRTEQLRESVERMQGAVWTPERQRSIIGDLFIGVAARGAFDQIVLRRGVENLYKPGEAQGRYTVKPGEDTTAWNVYSAMTDFLSNGEKVHVDALAPKTLDVYKAVTSFLN